MNIFLFSLFSIISASGPKDFLTGFLSGFQGTDVNLGESCLEMSWVNSIEGEIDSILSGLQNKQYLTVISQSKLLFNDFAKEIDDCHVPDLKNIINSLNQLSLNTKIYRVLANFNGIIDELEQAKTDNLYVSGFHIGKALFYLENENSHLPSINTQAFGDFFYGLFSSLVTTSPACNTTLNNLNQNLKNLLDSAIKFANGDENAINSIQFDLVLIAGNYINIKSKCDAAALPGKFYYSFFTQEGMVASYIKFGMNLKKIKEIEAAAANDLIHGRFVSLGSDFGQIINILIR